MAEIEIEDDIYDALRVPEAERDAGFWISDELYAKAIRLAPEE